MSGHDELIGYGGSAILNRCIVCRMPYPDFSTSSHLRCWNCRLHPDKQSNAQLRAICRYLRGEVERLEGEVVALRELLDELKLVIFELRQRLGYTPAFSEGTISSPINYGNTTFPPGESSENTATANLEDMTRLPDGRVMIHPGESWQLNWDEVMEEE